MHCKVANPLIRKPWFGYGVPSELILCLVLVTTLLLAPAGLRAQQPKPPSLQSMIADWSVVGPFANVGGTGVARRSPPELERATTSSFENMWGGVARWNAYHAADLLGWVNLTGHAPSRSCLFLARTAINAPTEQRVHLRLGLIGAARLYLNDSLVAAIDNDVFARSSSITISCTLGQGWNTLRIRIGREVMPLLAFSLAIEDTSGRPLSGLTINSAMQSTSSVNPAASMVDNRRDEVDQAFQNNEALLQTVRVSAELDTSGALWLTSQAQELLRSGNAVEALRMTRRALSLVQELAPAWHIKGLAHHKLGSKDSARFCIERALEIDPGLPEAWRSAFTVLERPHPLQEITPVNLDSLAQAAAGEPIKDSLQSETIFTDIQQAILSGSTVAKKAAVIQRIHTVDRSGKVPLPMRASSDPYTQQNFIVIGGDGSKRTVDLNDSAASLSDVRPGDVLVYRVERLVRDSTFPLFANADMEVSNADPVRRARLCVIVPPTAYYQFSTQNVLPDFTDRETPSGTIFTWEIRDVPRLVPEPDMPPAEHFAPRIAFGTFYNWRTVSTYAEDLYKRRMQPCDELRTLVERLLPSHTKWSKDVVVQTVTRWVIDSLELADKPSSLYAPHRACDVLQRKSATVSDKVALAITMLTERGVEALPALVNTNSGLNYNEPSPGLAPFNHVIVVVPGETRAQMVDLSERTMPFGMAPRLIEDKYGLPLGQQMRDPVLMHRRFINTREFHVRSVVTFNDAKSASHEISLRASDIDSSFMFKRKRLLDEMRSPRFDTAWIVPTPSSPLTPTIHMRGVMDGKSDFQVGEFELQSDTISDTVSLPIVWSSPAVYKESPYDLERRAFPLLFNADYDSVTAEILIVPPKGYRFGKPLAPVSFSLPSISYSFTATMSGKSLRLRRTVVLHKTRVESADYPAFREAHRSMIKADKTPVVLIRTGKPRRK
ncbi:MAG: DUF3857 domain-containing protein [Candidatus Kapaibacterium sp.]